MSASTEGGAISFVLNHESHLASPEQWGPACVWPGSANTPRQQKITKRERRIASLTRELWGALARRYVRADDIAKQHGELFPVGEAAAAIAQALVAGWFSAGSRRDVLYLHAMREPIGGVWSENKSLARWAGATAAELAVLFASPAPIERTLQWIWVRREAYAAWARRKKIEPAPAWAPDHPVAAEGDGYNDAVYFPRMDYLRSSGTARSDWAAAVHVAENAPGQSREAAARRIYRKYRARKGK